MHVDRCLSIRVCSVGVLCRVASICRVLACVRVDSYVCVSTSILIRGLPHPQRLLKSPWPGGDPHPIQNFKMKIFRFKFRGCCLNKRTWMIPIHTRHVRMHACHAACHAHEINFIRYSPQPFWFSPYFSHLFAFVQHVSDVLSLTTWRFVGTSHFWIRPLPRFPHASIERRLHLTLRGFLGYRVC